MSRIGQDILVHVNICAATFASATVAVASAAAVLLQQNIMLSQKCTVYGKLSSTTNRKKTHSKRHEQQKFPSSQAMRSQKDENKKNAQSLRLWAEGVQRSTIMTTILVFLDSLALFLLPWNKSILQGTHNTHTRHLMKVCNFPFADLMMFRTLVSKSLGTCKM